MTNEQYYWFVRRQQLLRAHAAMNNLHQAAVAAGTSEGDTEKKASSATELRDAMTKAKDGDTIKLTAPITLADGQQSILVDKNLTFDLNGQTIEATSLAGDTKDAVFAVKRGGTLTLNGTGTVDGSKVGSVYSAVKTTVKNETAEGPVAKLIINGGTYKGTYYAVTGNGSRQNTDVTINNGTFEGTTAGDSMAYFHPENGVLTINSGTFKGNDCIVVKSGTVKINNGTFEANGAMKEFEHSGNGWNCTGDCFIVEACDYPGQLPTVEITGGTFSSTNGKPVASYAQEGYTRITKFVKGGKFNKELDADLIADGYEQVQDGDWWIVKQI